MERTVWRVKPNATRWTSSVGREFKGVDDSHSLGSKYLLPLWKSFFALPPLRLLPNSLGDLSVHTAKYVAYLRCSTLGVVTL